MTDNNPHRRKNMLTGEWVLVSPQRSKRPWSGEQSDQPVTLVSGYDTDCYLCSGNKRISGEVNPSYSGVFVFQNDFEAITRPKTNGVSRNEGLLHAEPEIGECRVVCYSPNHCKTMSQLEEHQIVAVVVAWQEQFIELSQKEEISYIQIFENKGEMMGCSNPHPHGQIWAQNNLPNEVVKRDQQQKIYFNEQGKSLLTDYLYQEQRLKERILFENEHFVVLVPYWAIWPFETMIIPKAHQSDISKLNESERLSLAAALKRITMAYDLLFDCPFPYSMGIHQSPTDPKNREHWHWHMTFYPPLLRSALVRKHMVGYEMFAMPQRDFTAEMAAEMLKSKLKNL